MPPKRISILGVGLLGGSIGLAIKSLVSDCQIIGYGHRQSTLDNSIRLGAIDRAFTDPAAAVEGADLVILCTPVGLFGEILAKISDALSPEAIFTDVGSTKQSVVQSAGKLLKYPTRFVGSHPMAGSEKRGVEFARADLFRGAHCITTPLASTDPKALEDVEAFWKMLGMRISRLAPDEHDRILAEVSHLPHAVAAALVAMQSEKGLSLCGPGFRDATRIAAGDAGLWRDIFIDNKQSLSASLRRLRDELDQLQQKLDDGDAKAIEQWLDAAARRRNSL
ncbi:MAG TPA: prephenate dehydrogenase [Tepidisphaeraceae bacterium]|nr:prephenate dehydrogenase [Tepidisphaeraceae bacterium]